MTYKEYKEIQQKTANELPIFWAFSMRQFEEAMQERGLTVNDTDKIYSFGGGGYYLKSDAEVIRAYFNRKSILPELMKDPLFAEDAFYYEMFNAEYGYNGQADYDVCRIFGDCEYSYWKDGPQYLRDMGYGEETIMAYKRAERMYYKKANL